MRAWRDFLKSIFSSNILIPQNSSFTIKIEKEKWQILTFKKMFVFFS